MSNALITYLGFEENGREVELFLGSAFETHLPRRNWIVFRQGDCEVAVRPGEKLERMCDGRIEVRPQPDEVT